MDSATMLAGVGRRLAEAREARQWSQAVVAEKLKLSTIQIAAIEAESPEQLPAPVFLRGFLRNYAQLLGLDPDALLQSDAEAVSPSNQVTAPSAGVYFGAQGLRRWLLLIPAVAGVFLVLLVVVYLWLSQGSSIEVSEPAPLQPPASEAAATPAATPAAAPAVPPEAPEVAPAIEAVTPPAPATPPPVGEGRLKFMPQADAWIEVRDHAGKRLLFRNVVAGEAVEVSGQPPFELMVNNAAQVSLLYNGRAFDLKPFIGKKAARLTLE